MSGESAAATPPALRPGHVEVFARVHVGERLLTAAGIRSVTDSEARDFGFRFSSGADLSGILFPYLDPEASRRTTARLRRDHPELDATGRPEGKYVSPYGDNRHLYFPPGAGVLLGDISVPIVIVEAEKSALALTAFAERTGRRFLAIATGGCWGWRGRVGIGADPHGDRKEIRGPLADLGRIEWSGRVAIVCFDANAMTNPKVRAARQALAKELVARGALVRIVGLPQQENVNGPDDLIAVCGDNVMLALIDSAQTFGETALAEAELAVGRLEADKRLSPDLALQAIAEVDDALQRTLLLGRVLALRIPGLTKPFLHSDIGCRVRDAEQQVKEVQALARRERLLRAAVDPARLISDLEIYYSRRRHLPEGAALVEALFCLNTYVFDVFDTTPYLLYESATMGCGKTTALGFHEAVCAGAYLGVDPTPAVLYRRIDRDHPTWLLDEASVLQARGDRAQELLVLFDAGYKEGASVSRCEDHGDGLRDFGVYCPKVLAKIGGFSGTLLDRGIVVHLEKEPGLSQTRRRILKREASPLKEALEAYALQCREKLARLYEEEPDMTYWPELSGRESEIWGPLLTHSRLAGPDIERRALDVARRFSRGKAEIAIAEDVNLALSQEALEILAMRETESFRPGELVEELAAKEAWGVRLEERKTEKAKVSAVGKFFRRFRLRGKHTSAGTEYSRLEAIGQLTRHIPGCRRDGGVNASASGATSAESGNWLNDTSKNEVSREVSGGQTSEPAWVLVPHDTMKPQTRGLEEDL
jgi:hypothetical protein